MLAILVVILLLIALGALPTWPYSRGWGYYPSGGLGLVLLILVIPAYGTDLDSHSPEARTAGSANEQPQRG
jgi:hypothetical protein